MNVYSDIELKDSITCSKNQKTTKIQIMKEIQSVETFLIENITNLIIKNNFPRKNNYDISIRTKRIFNILNSYQIIFHSLFLRGTSIGGGITISNSNISLINCTIFPENVVTGTIFGGGIKIENNSYVTLENSTIKQWKVMEGGGIYLSNSQLLISNSLIIKNSVTNIGGGIFLTTNSILTIIKSTSLISNNSINDGGVIYSDQYNKITIKDTKFINNTAGRESGCIYISNSEIKSTELSISNTELNKNTAGSYSGGISIRNTIATFEDVTCIRNFGSTAGSFSLFYFFIFSSSSSSLSSTYYYFDLIVYNF